MAIHQQRTFLYALILTLVVFNVGIFMGYMLESNRINKINAIYLTSEIGILDQIIQKDSISVLNPSCDKLINENINFANNIFEEAKKIEEYENANVINQDIIFQHKRFDLLRALLFINMIKIEDTCNNTFHTILYVYQYNNPSIDQRSKQKFFSNVLNEIKDKYGNDLILIPLAGDNNIPSINLIKETYNITQFPSILIDEKVVLTDINSVDEINKYLN